MRRSAGVTISAVLVFVGCGVTVLIAVMMGLSLTVAVPNGTLPHGYGYAIVFLIVAALVFVGWGIASGIGLLKLREWSRVSMLAFAALLLVLAIPSTLVLLFVQLPSATTTLPNPEVSRQAMGMARLIGAALYAVVGVLGAGWFYFFSRRSVKDEFSAPREGTAAPGLASSTAPGARTRKRPLSITIIAGLMMIGTFSLPALLVIHFPVMFLGFYFDGAQAFLIVLAYAVTQAAIAYGLWDLKPWARSAAIYYYNFAIFNTVIAVILPGAQARYEAAMASVESALGTPQTSTLPFPLWVSLIFALPVIAVQLGFLIASKKAFDGNR
jgi:hypothetical protein